MTDVIAIGLSGFCLGGEGRVCFVMLNPSTADAQQNDPTVRRCLGYASQWGYDKLTVLNIFAYRATDPKELLKQSDPVGPDNESTFLTTIPKCDKIICAWGNHGDIEDQDVRALEWIMQYKQPYALKVNRKTGSPAHPLYLPSDLKPEPYVVF